MNEQYQRIRLLKDVMGMSFRQIAEQIGIGRKRCAKIYQGDFPKCSRSRGSLLDPYYSLITGWFNEFPRLKAIQVYEWLRERDVNVSYPWVVKYTRELRKKKKGEIFYPLTFLSGEEAQVDWCFVKQPGILTKCDATNRHLSLCTKSSPSRGREQIGPSFARSSPAIPTFFSLFHRTSSNTNSLFFIF